MFRSASRVIARPTTLRALPRASAPARRFISTAPPTEKSRSWKSLVARFGIAGTIIYYYNTTDVFAEEPKSALHALPETEETEQLPTIEALAKERQERRARDAAAAEAAAITAAAAAEQPSGANEADVGGVEQLEEEAGQQGAFNPETGEINWDCPCLGGMAHGPCGEEFKAAFSCFVYSTEEEKGIDCIDKFKGMQNCFREYPEIYGSELERDEVDEELAEQGQSGLAASPEAASPEKAAADVSNEPTSVKASTEAARKTPSTNEDEPVVPRKSFDERGANGEKK